jgi:large subunit ribosomal protein L7Ae
MRWPKYIQLQRQKKNIKLRLKIPPSIFMFEHVPDKSFVSNVFKLFKKYQAMTPLEKKNRLREIAKIKSQGKETPLLKYQHQIKFGLNHVTNLVQRKKAKIVLIAHDVEPLELVIWLPTLCYKMDIPFAIIKGKSTLGQLVRMKVSINLKIFK